MRLPLRFYQLTSDIVLANPHAIIYASLSGSSFFGSSFGALSPV